MGDRCWEAVEQVSHLTTHELERFLFVVCNSSLHRASIGKFQGVRPTNVGSLQREGMLLVEGSETGSMCRYTVIVAI